MAIGKGRAIGAYSLGQGFLNSAASTKLDDLLLDLDKLNAEYGLKIADALDGSPRGHQALDGLTAASRDTIKQSATLFEDKVIMADTLDTPWQQFYDQVTASLDKTYQLNDGALAFLKAELEKRLAEKRVQTVLLVVALLVVFLAIVYLYSGFYVSTRTTLKSLGKVMDQVAGGDMTVSFRAESRDELGELGQVFNGTVAKIHDLIELVGHTVAEVERQASRVEQVSDRAPGQRNRPVGERDQPTCRRQRLDQSSAGSDQGHRRADQPASA
jgi:methyl-accepting chemotaxis protein